MWELDHKEGWALKNWHFWTVVLEKTPNNCGVQSPLDCKGIKPVNPKGNQPWISFERTVDKLKLQYFGHLIWRADSLEKTLMLGKIEDKRKRGWQKIRWLNSITNSMDMNLSKFQEIVKDRGACALDHGVTKSWTRHRDWTTTKTRFEIIVQVCLNQSLCPFY